MNRPLLLSAVLLLALTGLAAAPAHAQYALRTNVVGAGATDASGGAYRLRGTAGQPAVGRASGGAYAAGQGFWYAATRSGGGGGPALSVTATPLNPPITVPAGGGEFRFRITITNNTATAQSFQAWITATLPNGSDYHVLGPQALTLGPNQTFGPVTLRQRIPANAPTGAYAHNVRVGTFPGGAVATGSFPWAKSATPLVPGGEVLARGGGTRSADAGVREASAAASSRTEPREDALRGGLAARAGAGRGAGRGAGWLLLIDATGAPVGEGGDLALAMPIDKVAEARISAEEEAREAAREGAGEAEEATGEAAVETTDGATTALNATSDAPPAAVALLRPFPNPGARATLRFGLPEAGPVRLAVYDVTGRRVALLVDEAREQGWHTAAFDAPGLASGVYLVRLEAGGHVLTHRFTLLR